jgi:hypothetical protein
MSNGGIFYGVGVQPRNASFTDANTLLKIITAAWGESRKEPYGVLPDQSWHDSGVSATWRYNRFSYEAQVLIMDISRFRQVQEIEKKKAQQAADAL